ncbi:MAG: calcium-translocating P-type ATPase, PMCA-type [bacterium]|nr:calcium-translocating P-type ATPase, PMCA-type [bacterium]
MLTSKNWHLLDIADLYRETGSSSEGLSSDQAKERFAQYGPNMLEATENKSLLKLFFGQFNDFMIWILLAAAVISSAIGLITGSHEELYDAAAIFAIVILNALLGFFQENKAEKALAALKDLSAPVCTVIRDGRISRMPAADIVPGDILQLEAGDRVPADIRLIESTSLSIDESLLTGESVPVEKQTLTLSDPETALANRINMAYMGSTVTLGRGRGIAVATGMRTEVGKIADMINTGERDKTPLQQKLEVLGKNLGILVLAIAAIVFVLGIARGGDISFMFLAAVGLAVAAIPEGLPAVVTIALALGVQRMAERQAVVRRLSAVEALGSVTVICSDKTGTITQNKMTVTELYIPGAKSSIPLTVGALDAKTLLTLAVLCNNAEIDVFGNEVGDPTELALINAAGTGGIDTETIRCQYARISELPFDSVRKSMTTIHRLPDGRIRAAVKGAVDRILPLVSGYLKPDGSIERIGPEIIDRIHSANAAMAGKALRVLAVAYRELEDGEESGKSDEIENDLVIAGLVGMIDPPRPEVVQALKTCHAAGIKPVMITGDHQDTAVAIAGQIGLLHHDGAVYTGRELESMADEELTARAPKAAVFARVSPEHKVRIVKAMKANGYIVGMTGDGVNDAPALKRADIGVAMGQVGTDVSREASDVILLDDNFATIVSAIGEGRVIYANIKKFIRYLLSCNTSEVLTVFISMLAGMPLPVLPAQLLWINIATDGLPALALGVEPGDPALMNMPPRNADERIIDKAMSIRIFREGLMMSFIALSAFFIMLKQYGGVENTPVRTAVFTVLVLSQLWHSLNSRSEERSIFGMKGGNGLLVAAIAISIILQLIVVYTPFLQTFFRTEPLKATDWLIILPLSLLIVVEAEIYKAVRAFRISRKNGGKDG